MPCYLQPDGTNDYIEIPPRKRALAWFQDAFEESSDNHDASVVVVAMRVFDEILDWISDHSSEHFEGYNCEGDFKTITIRLAGENDYADVSCDILEIIYANI
jgi:hypothetical protein